MEHRTRFLRRGGRTLAVAALAMAGAVVAPGLPASAESAGIAAAGPSFTRIEGTAASAAGLAPTVNAYRKLLGNPDNGSAVGSQPAGRREINWDGVPDGTAAPNALPRDFFNTTVTRGAVFASGAGSRFQVSADASNPTRTAVRFGNLNPAYPRYFGTFSRERLFTPLGTNKMSVRFFVPGTNRPAAVKGFGAVFTDVDRADSTKLELYDKQGHQLWSRYVPRGRQTAKSLSFLGVATTANIYEVRITSGNVPLSAHNTDTASRDVVAMDDFVYGEPKLLH